MNLESLDSFSRNFENNSVLFLSRAPGPFVGAEAPDFHRNRNSLSKYLKIGCQKTFESKHFLNQFATFNFLKTADFSKDQVEKKDFEKKQNSQKKRRLKKLKLENRRRKKRKRFYPRPLYLRFHLSSNFLNKRYLRKFQKSFSQPKHLSGFETSFKFPNTPILQFNNFGKLDQSEQALSFHEKLYRQKKQNWGKVDENFIDFEKSFLKHLFLTSQTPIYHSQEFYKISNKTLGEFERLCWKSYWLRSNLKPYLRKIQQNLKIMKRLETAKESQSTIFQLLTNFATSFASPFSQLHFSKLDLPFIKETQVKTLSPGYFNIKEILDSSDSSAFSWNFWKNFENKAEFNRLLYERITDEIKNVKSQLNVDGQNHVRSYKSGRQKIEPSFSKTLFHPFQSIQKQLSDPKILAFSMFSVPNDSSIKPFGDLPTLRILWAVNKTNLLTCKETHFAKNIWSIYKAKEQTKNNQTKKLLLKTLHFSPFKSKTPDKISFEKIKFASKKTQLLGNFVFGKNYVFYLRTLKYQLRFKNRFIFEKKENSPFVKNDLNLWFENRFNQKPQKRAIHFWWSGSGGSVQAAESFHLIKKLLSFWWSAAMPSPLLFPTLTNYIDENQNVLLRTNRLETPQVSDQFSFLLEKTFHKNLHDGWLTTTFWLCCLLFHLSMLLTLIRIPEIKSLAKFQFLMISKFTNIYLTTLFYFHDFFKNYQMTILCLFKKTMNFGFQHSSNNFSFFNADFSKIGDFQNSQKNSTTMTNLLSSTFLKQGAHSFSSNLSISSKNSKKRFKNSFVKKGGNPLEKTITSQFYFRNWNLSVQNFEKSFDFSKLNNRKNFFNVFDFLKNSSLIVPPRMNPYFLNNTRPKSPRNFQDSNFFKQSSFSKNWFYSWYTGFLWYTFENSLNKKSLNGKKDMYLKDFTKLGFSRKSVNSQINISTRKNILSGWIASNIQIQYSLSLVILFFSKSVVYLFAFFTTLFYKCLLQVVDLMESILLLFYKFLEKPAELMVDWIAEFFLVEWSSDFMTYMPEAFDTKLHQSFIKFSRSFRAIGLWNIGFFRQRLFFNSLETFYHELFKPDTDLILRQKKGMIFWDIWTEILLQAAEKYQMNLSSLSTIKEEQDLLIENLLEEKRFDFKDPLKNSIEVDNSKVKKGSIMFKTFVTKLTPFFQFLEIYPANDLKRQSVFLDVSQVAFRNNPALSLPYEVKLNTLKIFQKTSKNLVFGRSQSFLIRQRWSVNQYLTTQGRDTDLFMDLHSPKSFLHLSFLKTYLPAQEILGSLVCDIYSNLFAQKVSKNILVVGAPGTAKSSFIQALAGETEFKIVIDNAHRYAVVQGGVPTGMKLLRDVFDSISLHTPCLFLLEDIHIIGERRPMLISDDETSKANDSSFGAEQEEVHEKNRLIYQLSRHSLSHYKKPYKGDFSLSIPTNHFCYDLFLGISASRKRHSDLTPKSPLPFQQLEKSFNSAETAQRNTSTDLTFDVNKTSRIFIGENLVSCLQLSSEQVFAPPATSPFNILLMKEQKKLKPKKLVKELPWSGLSYDQFMLISKSSYSVRVKVALLAEFAMTNLSVKLDMITDLLVIIDSVRSNRGFVVFATTHVPGLLDPALRRPGRLDETITLPLFPNLMSRLEIFKTHLSSYTDIIDFLDYSFFTSIQKENENQISQFLDKNLLLLFNQKNSAKLKKDVTFFKSQKFKSFIQDYPISSLSQAFQSFANFNGFLWNTKPRFFQNGVKTSYSIKTSLEANIHSTSGIQFKTKLVSNELFTAFLNQTSPTINISGADQLNYLSISYGQSGQFLVEALLLNDQTTYRAKFTSEFLKVTNHLNTEEFMFNTLYSSKLERKNLLLKLFAGKIAEFFVFRDLSSAFGGAQKRTQRRSLCTKARTLQKPRFSLDLFENLKLNSKTDLKKNWWLTNPASLQTNPSQSSLFQNVQNFETYWKDASLLLDSFFQKRYLYSKNKMVSKLFYLEDSTSFREAPSPPNSSILMPAKKFETYKRTLRDFIQKPLLTIQEKLQLHQKQRFLKLLYKIDLQTSFQTVFIKSFKESSAGSLKCTRFSNSGARPKGESFVHGSALQPLKELAYLDFIMEKPSSSYYFYKNRFLTRHRFSFLNQWWNGQLEEHNVQTTYLSHVDWRSMFVQSLGDLVIDFPDTEQYYNPRMRRWFLHSSSWNYWLSFEQNLKEEISQYSINQSFIKISTLFHENRELLDYVSFRFLRYHTLKEIDVLPCLIRFYQTHKTQ